MTLNPFTLIKKLIASFDNTSEGFSGRKLSAFVGVVIAGKATLGFTNHENLFYVTCAWLLFSLLCLGIVTAEQIIKFKSGGTTFEKTEKTEKIVSQ